MGVVYFFAVVCLVEMETLGMVLSCLLLCFMCCGMCQINVFPLGLWCSSGCLMTSGYLGSLLFVISDLFLLHGS